MGTIRTVTLELLRHGPRHNQLLSPLTPYLAICGDHPAGTLSVPFEHHQFVNRMDELHYPDETSDSFQVKDMAGVLRDMLQDVPSLVAELNRFGGGNGVVHLDLVLSAAELALLPFELADTPNGLPGAGQPLTLQAHLPVALTRRARRVGPATFPWPSKPRVLLVSASPEGVPPVPFPAHLIALRMALLPWMGVLEGTDEAKRQKKTDEYFVFLRDASIASIRAACRNDHFTHVHILAHGIDLDDKYGSRYGIALCDSTDATKLAKVDGATLATALTCGRTPAGGMNRPAVVTLASCVSGQQGKVVGAGASVAHELHAAGIPFVVASQFPMTAKAAFVMVKGFYESLLWGADPRDVLCDVRRQMRTDVRETHDWASLVAYGSFPADLEHQLSGDSGVRVMQARRCVDAAMEQADDAIDRLSTRDADTGDGENEERQPGPNGTDLLKQVDKRIGRAIHKLQSVMSDRGPTAEVQGLLASVYKRQAQLLHRWSALLEGEARESYCDRSVEMTRKASDAYEQAIKLGRSVHWVLSQHVSLSVVLGDLTDRVSDYWTMARLSAELDLESTHRETVAWAHGTLAELFMLSSLLNGMGGQPAAEQSRRRALDHARSLVRALPRDAGPIYSTRRQFQRYESWFSKLPTATESLREHVVPVANEIVTLLPECKTPDWY